MPYNYTIPRGPIAAMYSSPGPARYGLPTLCGQIKETHDPRSQHNKKPAYSFGLKPPLPPEGSGPGPKYFPDSKIYRDGKDGTPHYSMTARGHHLTPFNTPGPAAYSPERAMGYNSTMPSAPQHSLHKRFNDCQGFKTPAPNSYSLPKVFGGSTTADSTKRSCPTYTMRPKYTRGSFAEDMAKAPGPGTYNETSPSVYKQKMPQPSLAARVFPPGDNTQKPGPGAHRPEDVHYHREPPSYTFGIKHSPYTATMVAEPKE